MSLAEIALSSTAEPIGYFTLKIFFYLLKGFYYFDLSRPFDFDLPKPFLLEPIAIVSFFYLTIFYSVIF